MMAGPIMVSAQFDAVNDTICHNCPFPRLVDLDNDGDIDLILTTPEEDTISWRRNQGNGIFDDAIFLALNDHHLSIDLVGDADGDGDPDLIGASLTPTYTDSVLAILRNNGGAFTFEIIDEHITANRSPTRFADLDDDGLLDILGLPDAASGERWYRNLGNGGYQRETMSYWCQLTPGPFAALDVEGDGDIDLATYPPGNLRRIVVFWNLGGGKFGPPTWASPQYGSALLVRPAIDAAELNGDGFMDLVVGGRPCISEGNGHFNLPTQLFPMNYQSIADADCEPTLEAFVSSTTLQATPGLGELSIPGSFVELTAPVILPLRSALANLDDDTLPDLLLGPINGETGPVYWRKNNAIPIPIHYDHPVESVVAGTVLSVVYPPIHIGPDTVVADGDFYTGNGVIGDSLYTADMPTGYVVITAHYASFNSQTECESLSQDSIYVLNTVGIAESTVNSVQVFPNPVNDQLHVRHASGQPLRAVIRDVFGRVLKVRTLTNKPIADEVIIDCADLAAGTYVIGLFEEDRELSSVSFVVVH